jgi:hypothetical protein
MVLTSYQGCAYSIPSLLEQWKPHQTHTYQAQRNSLTTTTRQPTLHRHTTCASPTDTTPEQGGTFRTLYMANTKTKPSHDSSHTTPSSNKPRQMICSKAHQGGANKARRQNGLSHTKILQSQKPPLPTSTAPELALLRANYLRK